MSANLAPVEFAHDGNYLAAFPIDPPRWEFPFRNNGDHITAYFEQDYIQSKTTFVPHQFTISHQAYPDFYLIDETHPVEFLAGSGLWRFTRTWSRIPEQQTIPGSRFITKPDLPGTFPQVSGESLIIQPEENVPRWVFYSQIPVTSDSGPPGSGSYPTGGTYTLTTLGQTTSAIAFDASAATVQSALNALSQVTARGGVVVTGTYTAGFSILWNPYPNGSVDASSLTLSFGSGTTTSMHTVNLVQMNVVINSNAGLFNGGTFTLTVLGQTTAAIAYNASLTTVKTALEALSNIGTGGIYTVGNGGSGYTTTVLNSAATQIGFTFEISQASITADGTSLTPTGSTATVTNGTAAGGNTGFYRNLRFTGVVLATRVLATSSDHGIVAADSIVVTQGSNYRTLTSGTFSVTANTITLTAASGVAFTDATTITVVGKQNGNEYTAGSKLTRIKRVTDFYLPGVSSGITTADDIPLPDYEGDDASLLSAIFNGDTDINYEVGELEYYRNGPILMRTRTTLNAATL